jgi:hypothetical protein
MSGIGPPLPTCALHKVGRLDQPGVLRTCRSCYRHSRSPAACNMGRRRTRCGPRVALPSWIRLDKVVGRDFPVVRGINRQRGDISPGPMHGLSHSDKSNPKLFGIPVAYGPTADAAGRRARKCKNRGSRCQRRPRPELTARSGTLGSRRASMSRPAPSSAKK